MKNIHWYMFVKTTLDFNLPRCFRIHMSHLVEYWHILARNLTRERSCMVDSRDVKICQNLLRDWLFCLGFLKTLLARYLWLLVYMKYFCSIWCIYKIYLGKFSMETVFTHVGTVYRGERPFTVNWLCVTLTKYQYLYQTSGYAFSRALIGSRSSK